MTSKMDMGQSTYAYYGDLMTGTEAPGAPVSPVRSPMRCLAVLLYSVLPFAALGLAFWRMPETGPMLRNTSLGRLLGGILAVGQLLILLLMFVRGARNPRRWYTLVLANLCLWPLTVLGFFGPKSIGFLQTVLAGDIRSLPSRVAAETLGLPQPTVQASSTTAAGQALAQPITSPPMLTREIPQEDTPEAAARRFMHALLGRNIPEVVRIGLNTERADMLYKYRLPSTAPAFRTLEEMQVAALNFPEDRLFVGEEFTLRGKRLKVTKDLIDKQRAMVVLLDQLLFLQRDQGKWKVDAGTVIVDLLSCERDRVAAGKPKS